MKTAKEQFLLNWDEGHDNPDHDGIPTKMEKGLDKVILEAQQQVKYLDIPDAINAKRMYCLRKNGKCLAKILICGALQSVECPYKKQTI